MAFPICPSKRAVVIAALVLAVPLLGIACKRDDGKTYARPTTCTLDDIKHSRCPASAPFADTDVITHPRFGPIVRGRLNIVFRDDTSAADAIIVVESIPAEVIAASSVWHEYTVRLDDERAEAIDAAIGRLDQDERVRIVVPEYVGTTQ